MGYIGHETVQGRLPPKGPIVRSHIEAAQMLVHSGTPLGGGLRRKVWSRRHKPILRNNRSSRMMPGLDHFMFTILMQPYPTMLGATDPMMISNRILRPDASILLS